MLAKHLWVTGALIFLMLGAIHLFYTFFTNKFSSRNNKVIEEMQSSYPVLTKETTMWKAWIGFNASHSMGVIFIAVINIYLAVYFFSFLPSEIFVFNIVTVSFYLFMAKKYWFKIPFIGVLFTLLCFITSYILKFF